MSDNAQQGRKASEQERRAAALRENLKRRKAQARGRTVADSVAAPETGGPSHESAGFEIDKAETERGTG